MGWLQLVGYSNSQRALWHILSHTYKVITTQYNTPTNCMPWYQFISVNQKKSDNAPLLPRNSH